MSMLPGRQWWLLSEEQKLIVSLVSHIYNGNKGFLPAIHSFFDHLHRWRLHGSLVLRCYVPSIHLFRLALPARNPRSKVDRNRTLLPTQLLLHHTQWGGRTAHQVELRGSQSRRGRLRNTSKKTDITKKYIVMYNKTPRNVFRLCPKISFPFSYHSWAIEGHSW